MPNHELIRLYLAEGPSGRLAAFLLSNAASHGDKGTGENH